MASAAFYCNFVPKGKDLTKKCTIYLQMDSAVFYCNFVPINMFPKGIDLTTLQFVRGGRGK